MKRVFVDVFVLSLGLSCIQYPKEYFDQGRDGFKIVQASVEEENEKRAERRRERERSESRRGSSGRICEKNRDCIRICESLYENDGAVDECGEFRTSIVEEMDEIADALEDEDITVKELNRFDIEIFEDMLKISIHPWIEATEEASEDRSHARTVLSWVASNPETIYDPVMEYGGEADFDENYKSHEGLARLLDRIGENKLSSTIPGRVQCAKYCNALTVQKIGINQTFQMILASQEGSSTPRSDDLMCDLYGELPQDLEEEEEEGGGATCSDLTTPISGCNLASCP